MKRSKQYWINIRAVALHTRRDKTAAVLGKLVSCSSIDENHCTEWASKIRSFALNYVRQLWKCSWRHWEIILCCLEKEDQLRLQAWRNMQAAVMKIHQQLRRTDELPFRIRDQLRARMHAAIIHRVRSLNLPLRQCFQTKCNKFAINF